MNGLMTEREWRKQRRQAARSRCWGAQCVLPRAGLHALTEDKAFRAFLMLCSLMIAISLPVLAPRTERVLYPTALPEPLLEPMPEVRTVSAVRYVPVLGVPYHTVTYTHEQLLRGKLLLLDHEHPLPQGVPAPNTLSIAGYGRGMVAVSDLTVKSGRETISALTQLFTSLRSQGVNGFAVWRATQSPAEQRELRIAQMARYASALPLEEAARRAMLDTDTPATGDLLQEFSVELRTLNTAGTAPDDAPLADTNAGRILLRTAWRYGFIHRYPADQGARGFRFRYVGQAHATAMTYLDIGFEDYLAVLHHKSVLYIERDEEVRYLILCHPMQGTHMAFDIPVGATVLDAGIDNTGYAVLACELPPA